jgi:hypothetical protein
LSHPDRCADRGCLGHSTGQIHEHAWLSPARAHARQEAAEIELAPPTWVTLHALSRWRGVEESLAAVRERGAEYFETHVAIGDQGPIALWQGDAGWEQSDATAPGSRHRLVMGPDPWRYERS